MEYLVGAGLALGVGVLATVVGLDRGRTFYPVVLIVIASYYDLFAVMGGARALPAETSALAVFVVLAVVGFKSNLWLVVAALAGHGVFDLVHPSLIENQGAPGWWPMFCLAYDVAAGAYLAARLLSSSPSRLRARP
jgi:hypothetical protein